MEEEHGNAEEARIAFLHALEMDPWLRNSQILETSELIDSLLHAEPDVSVLSKSNLLVWEGWQKMQADRFELAESAFARAIQINPYNAKAYAGLALLYQRKGQSQAAEFNVQTALFIGGTSPELLNIAGRVALQQGRREDALWFTELAYRQLMNQSFSWSYYNRTYQRFFVEPDLVPLLRLVEIDLDMAYDINLLAEYFVSSGREKEAQQLIDGKPLNAHE
jgi:Tfp pilus assembly protein PilF